MILKNRLTALMHLGSMDAGNPPMLDRDACNRLMRDLRDRYDDEDDSVDQERLNLDANGFGDQ